ncbi:MAG: ABC transporter permease [Gemmatimonadales bacterium]
MNLLIGAVTFGFIGGLLAVGVYLTFRLFATVDLTAEGAYGLGAAVAGVLLAARIDPMLATIAGGLAGAAAGVVTGLLHTRLGVPRLLAGILTSTALYAVILFLMHGGDLSLAPQRTLVSIAERSGTDLVGGDGELIMFGTPVGARNWMGLLYSFALVASTIIALGVFLRTELGLALRATGDNPRMATAQGVDVGMKLVLVYALSNGLIGASGAIFAQYVGFANIQLGVGALVTGLASLMIGETIFRRGGPGRGLAAAVAGAILFRLLVAGALVAGLNPNALKLVTATFVLIALLIGRALPGRSEAGGGGVTYGL